MTVPLVGGFLIGTILFQGALSLCGRVVGLHKSLCKQTIVSFISRLLVGYCLIQVFFCQQIVNCWLLQFFLLAKSSISCKSCSFLLNDKSLFRQHFYKVVSLISGLVTGLLIDISLFLTTLFLVNELLVDTSLFLRGITHLEMSSYYTPHTCSKVPMRFQTWT